MAAIVAMAGGPIHGEAPDSGRMGTPIASQPRVRHSMGSALRSANGEPSSLDPGIRIIKNWVESQN
jgi:hypothetical protein